MVTNITSFGRSGLSDWLMQRVALGVAVLTLATAGLLVRRFRPS